MLVLTPCADSPRLLHAAGTASPYPNRGSSFRFRFLLHLAAKDPQEPWGASLLGPLSVALRALSPR
jgi:hypothetical protein